LKAIGVPLQCARHSSLMDIASELPAYVFSWLLGSVIDRRQLGW
jgi:hypothetical protein